MAASSVFSTLKQIVLEISVHKVNSLASIALLPFEMFVFKFSIECVVL